MTREKRLGFCTICLNRKMNAQKGLLCGLTDEYATFESTCVDFKEDEKEKQYRLIRDLNASGHQNASKSIDYKKNKENGSIMFLIGFSILFFTMYNFDNYGIMIIPSGAIIYGARTYFKGLEQQKLIEEDELSDEEKIKGS